jgi:hypothetical protein
MNFLQWAQENAAAVIFVMLLTLGITLGVGTAYNKKTASALDTLNESVKSGANNTIDAVKGIKLQSPVVIKDSDKK